MLQEYSENETFSRSGFAEKTVSVMEESVSIRKKQLFQGCHFHQTDWVFFLPEETRLDYRPGKERNHPRVPDLFGPESLRLLLNLWACWQNIVCACSQLDLIARNNSDTAGADIT